MGQRASSLRPALSKASSLPEPKLMNATGVASVLAQAESVIVVPGWGFAQAGAGWPVAKLAEVLQASGVKVTFAIHPVAGRMPGQMNVLLAEASINYEIVKEMDDIQPADKDENQFRGTSVVLVVGANDICNSDAIDNPDSPIAGMPVLRVWDADKVIIMKRTVSGLGYEGIPNPTFHRDNAFMFLGDAKVSCEQLLQALRARARLASLTAASKTDES